MECEVWVRIESRGSVQGQTISGNCLSKATVVVQGWALTCLCELWSGMSGDQRYGFSFTSAPSEQEGQALSSGFLHITYCQ